MAMQAEKLLYSVLCILYSFSCLQLLATVKAMPLSQNETVANETECHCSGTNLSMVVDRHYLNKWLEFKSHHSIRHLSEAAQRLKADTDGLQVRALI